MEDAVYRHQDNATMATHVHSNSHVPGDAEPPDHLGLRAQQHPGPKVVVKFMDERRNPGELEQNLEQNLEQVPVSQDLVYFDGDQGLNVGQDTQVHIGQEGNAHVQSDFHLHNGQQGHAVELEHVTGTSGHVASGASAEQEGHEEAKERQESAEKPQAPKSLSEELCEVLKEQPPCEDAGDGEGGTLMEQPDAGQEKEDEAMGEQQDAQREGETEAKPEQPDAPSEGEGETLVEQPNTHNSQSKATSDATEAEVTNSPHETTEASKTHAAGSQQESGAETPSAEKEKPARKKKSKGSRYEPTAQATGKTRSKQDGVTATPCASETPASSRKRSKPDDDDAAEDAGKTPKRVKRDGVTLLQCDVCGKTFSDMWKLRRHEGSHSEKRHVTSQDCAVCGKAFPDTWHLRTHEATHVEYEATSGPAPLPHETAGDAGRTRHQRERASLQETEGSEWSKTETEETTSGQTSKEDKVAKNETRSVKKDNSDKSRKRQRKKTETPEGGAEITDRRGSRGRSSKTRDEPEVADNSDATASPRNGRSKLMSWKPRLALKPETPNRKRSSLTDITSGESAQKTPRSSGKKQGATWYGCDTCGKAFKDAWHLKRHQETHLENRKKSFQCEMCDMAFTDAWHLNRHSRTHSAKKSVKKT